MILSIIGVSKGHLTNMKKSRAFYETYSPVTSIKQAYLVKCRYIGMKTVIFTVWLL